MDGINQPAQSQPAPSNNQQQQSQKVAENQAEDFAKRMDKKKDGKDSKKGDLEGKKGEQSLESLLAERSKKVHGRQDKEQGQSQQDGRNPLESDLAAQGQLNDGAKEPIAAHGRDVQLQSEVQLKGIDKISGPKEINETINKLVDKIHVSAKDSINGAEVRLSMKDAILPGTEIRIQRMGGELTVTMNTTSAESHNFLAQHEASLLKSLSDRFGNDKVQVNINMSGGGGEENDGRSREEYVGEEEEQQEDNDQS